MEHIYKLYGKAYHLYTIEDWKYIFSIYKEKDKYNHTEEEFLAAELTDKTAMMKKMDEAIWKDNPFSKQSMDANESIFEPCPRDEGCEVIQDFLENDDLNIDTGMTPSDISACNPENSCDIIQDFLEEDGIDKFAIFRNIQNEYYGEIYQCQNRIEECKKKIRAEIQDIQVYKQKLDEAFNQYIE